MMVCLQGLAFMAVYWSITKNFGGNFIISLFYLPWFFFAPEGLFKWIILIASLALCSTMILQIISISLFGEKQIDKRNNSVSSQS